MTTGGGKGNTKGGLYILLVRNIVFLIHNSMGPTIYSLINTEVRIFHTYVYSPLINFSYVNQNVGLIYCGENKKN